MLEGEYSSRSAREPPVGPVHSLGLYDPGGLAAKRERGVSELSGELDHLPIT